jgi:hypothetical protein
MRCAADWPVRSVFRTSSLPQGGPQVLGANLKCSESEALGGLPLNMPPTPTRIAAHACAGTRFLCIYVRPARSIFSNALNFCRSAIAALVRSPWRYCPLRSPGGPPLPLAPPCNRQRPFFVAGDRQGFPLFVRAPH